MDVSVDDLRVFFEAVLPVLDERQRRLVAGAAARMLGRGGASRIAQAAGMSRNTVLGGIQEIAEGVARPGRVRAPGAGRKQLVESQPGLVKALDDLVDPAERTDQLSPLRWTVLSTSRLAELLEAQGFYVSPDSVGRLLKAAGYALQAPPRAAEASVRQADAQFRHIAAEARSRLSAGEPVVSVAISRKGGGGVGPEEGVRSEARPAVAVAHGIYALGGAEGWANVGDDDTAASLAVQAVGRWWQTMGVERHPTAKALMVVPHAGGPGRRSPAWNRALRRLAVEAGLDLVVCHHPPGTVRWTRTEHRLFSFVTDNRRDRPLATYRTIVELCAGTTTTALKERAELDEVVAPVVTGGDTAPEEIALPAVSEDADGEWNYTVPCLAPADVN